VIGSGTHRTGVVSASGTNQQSEAADSWIGYDAPNATGNTVYKAQVANTDNDSAASYTGINITLEEIQG
jgi:hypothetical protein